MSRGWALYAERLGLEVGFYEDPYSDFGRLTYEMWRACRLVVDTGIHAFGWWRQQAIDFMMSNTALTIHNITTEVDRYIAWPAQALAYKMGELKILEIRERAEKVLGSEFEVREFHDVVLGSGAVPLTVLEDIVDTYFLKKSRPGLESTPRKKILPRDRVMTGGPYNLHSGLGPNETWSVSLVHRVPAPRTCSLRRGGNRVAVGTGGVLLRSALLARSVEACRSDVGCSADGGFCRTKP